MSRRTRPAGARPDDVPVATRAASAGWRDPRLWVGVVLVVGSVVVGARVLATADDHTSVWVAARDLAPGTVIGADDLVASRVRFLEAGEEDRYLVTSDALPPDLELARGVDAGELVPAAALGSEEDSGLVRVSVSLASQDVPTEVASGTVVDVWIVGEDRRGEPSAARVLESVAVVDAPRDEGAWGSPSAGRQLVLAVPESERVALADLLAASGEGLVRVVARG